MSATIAKKRVKPFKVQETPGKELHPWVRPLDPETQKWVDQMVAEGRLLPPLKPGPRTPFKPLVVPGVSLSEILLEMRREEEY